MRDLTRCGYGHPRSLRLLCIADNVLHRLGNRVCDMHHLAVTTLAGSGDGR